MNEFIGWLISVWMSFPYRDRVDHVISYVTARPEAFVMGLLVLMTIFLLAIFLRTLFAVDRKNTQRKKKRSRTLSQRIKAIKLRIAADLITDALEDAVSQGKLRGKDVDWIYRRLGEAADIADFFPRRKNNAERKKRLREKLGLGPNDPIPSRLSARRRRAEAEMTEYSAV